jgi:hypothetical protein
VVGPRRLKRLATDGHYDRPGATGLSFHCRDIF